MHPKTAAALNNLAIVVRMRGADGEAESFHRRAIPVAHESGQPDETGIADLL